MGLTGLPTRLLSYVLVGNVHFCGIGSADLSEFACNAFFLCSAASLVPPTPSTPASDYLVPSPQLIVAVASENGRVSRIFPFDYLLR